MPEFEANLIYRAVSKTVKATQRDLVSKNITNKEKKNAVKELTVAIWLFSSVRKV